MIPELSHTLMTQLFTVSTEVTHHRNIQCYSEIPVGKNRDFTSHFLFMYHF